jgi:hypothetical protein
MSPLSRVTGYSVRSRQIEGVLSLPRKLSLRLAPVSPQPEPWTVSPRVLTARGVAAWMSNSHLATGRPQAGGGLGRTVGRRKIARHRVDRVPGGSRSLSDVDLGAQRFSQDRAGEDREQCVPATSLRFPRRDPDRLVRSPEASLGVVSHPPMPPSEIPLRFRRRVCRADRSRRSRFPGRQRMALWKIVWVSSAQP